MYCIYSSCNANSASWECMHEAIQMQYLPCKGSTISGMGLAAYSKLETPNSHQFASSSNVGLHPCAAGNFYNELCVHVNMHSQDACSFCSKIVLSKVQAPNLSKPSDFQSLLC